MGEGEDKRVSAGRGGGGDGGGGCVEDCKAQGNLGS